MLGLVILLTVFSIIAGVLAFTGLVIGVVVIAKILFFIFLVMLLISLFALFFR